MGASSLWANLTLIKISLVLWAHWKAGDMWLEGPVLSIALFKSDSSLWMIRFVVSNSFLQLMPLACKWSAMAFAQFQFPVRRILSNLGLRDAWHVAHQQTLPCWLTAHLLLHLMHEFQWNIVSLHRSVQRHWPNSRSKDTQSPQVSTATSRSARAGNTSQSSPTSQPSQRKLSHE